MADDQDPEKLAEATKAIAEILETIEQFGVHAGVIEECIEAAATGRKLPAETIHAARRMFEQMMVLPKWISLEQIKRGAAPPDAHM